MITVYLQKNKSGDQGSYGHGEDIDEAVDLARLEFSQTFGGRPYGWGAKFAGGKVAGRFSNYKTIEKKVREAMGIGGGS
jgi:hypothetical protein